MHDEPMFSNQRARIIKCQETERFPTSLARFRCIAEALLLPLFREIASVLSLEGLSAEALVGLEQTPPWVGLRIHTPNVVICVWPTDTLNWMNFSVCLEGDPATEEISPVSYRALVYGRLAQRINQALDNALRLNEPPF